jgi:protein-S-isoprenylcysteine O-methyltransferase Ste14
MADHLALGQEHAQPHIRAVSARRAGVRGGAVWRIAPIRPWGAIFLLWGYLQYRLVGRDRRARGGGGPGIEKPPERIVTDGAYRYLRNPMYLGHLIFMAGLAITFSSWIALALLVFHAGWFHLRVLNDEQRLESQFGESYRAYKSQVKRWIPGVL